MFDLLNISSVYPLFYLLWQVVLLLVLLDMTNRRRAPASMIGWFLVIFSIPYAGVLLYLFIGRRKISSTPHKPDFSESNPALPGLADPFEAVLHRNGIPPATEGNRFTLITDATEAFDALMEAIGRAEHSIWLATYIYGDDAQTQALSQALSAKAEAGVDVRLLIDAFGSFGLYLWPAPLDAMRRAGVRVEFFMPLRPFLRNTHFNLRLHRKIYLFNGRTVFSGGMNLSGEYLGPDDIPDRWEDLLFRIEGPAATLYRDVFASDWNFTSQEQPLPKHSGTTLPPAGEERIHVVPSGPDIASDALYEALINAIYNARERIWIVTPYFIPDESMMEALKIARRKGVDVKLITSERADHLLFEITRSSYMREIGEWGGDVVLYHTRMLHAKAILIDRSSVMVGTLNFDNRSLFLNYEIVSIGYDGTMVTTVEAWMTGLLSHAHRRIRPAGKLRRLFENLGRIIAPQL